MAQPRRFTLGSFPAASTADAAKPLRWCDDPATSLSDWLVVTTEPGGKRAEFNVHRNILGAGLRKSDYFAQLFFGSAGVALAEGNGRTSTLDLEQTAFDAFPAFLNFLYDGKLEISEASAVALLHLAHYLLNRALFGEVQRFIEAALNDNPGVAAPVFLEQAHMYHLEEVGDTCVTVCAELFLGQDPTYCTHLEPRLFVRVIQAVETADVSLQYALSDHIKTYCDRHKDAVDLALLSQLTAGLTTVSFASALGLLGYSLACGGPATLEEICTAQIGADWETSLLPAIQSSIAERATRASRAPTRSKSAAESSAADAPEADGWTPLDSEIFSKELQLQLLAEAVTSAAEELDETREQLAGWQAKYAFLKRRLKRAAVQFGYTVAYYGYRDEPEQPYNGLRGHQTTGEAPHPAHKLGGFDEPGEGFCLYAPGAPTLFNRPPVGATALPLYYFDGAVQ